MEKRNIKENGITLVALVITIVILLILAGITINSLTENGLFEKVKLAKQKQENAQLKENIILSEYEDIIGNLGIISSNRENEKTSSIIKEVTFSDSTATNLTKININIESEDNNKIIGYHIFVIDSNDSNIIKTRVTEDKDVTISDLSPNTKYKVLVVAYDIYNNYKSSEIKEITTLNTPVKLIPELTSNTSGGGNAFATYTGNGRSPWEAFDGIIPPSATGATPGYMVAGSSRNQIGYDFGDGHAKSVSKFVYYGNATDANCRFTEITLQYSDDGTNWTDVETFYPIVISSYSQPSDLAQEFAVSTPQSKHRYWRIDATNSGRSWSGLLELEFWGF